MAEVGRKVCCCLAPTWVRVIAWLQIIANVLAAIYIILALLGISLETNAGHPKPHGSGLIIFLIGPVVCLIGIIFGVILLRGVNQQRPKYLLAWIIFAVISLLWTILGAIFEEETDLGVKIGRCVVNILLYGFGIWVVNTLRRDIENATGGLHV